MNKQYFVNVVNLETGKIFSLPTLYTDRTEACVCGQNYVRDRQAEDRYSPLFFRVLISYDGKVAEPSCFTIEEDEDDYDCPDEQEDCFGCPHFSDCGEEGEEDEEEDEAEEPSSDSLAELLSVFNAIRPNY